MATLLKINNNNNSNINEKLIFYTISFNVFNISHAYIVSYGEN